MTDRLGRPEDQQGRNPGKSRLGVGGKAASSLEVKRGSPRAGVANSAISLPFSHPRTRNLSLLISEAPFRADIFDSWGGFAQEGRVKKQHLRARVRL